MVTAGKNAAAKAFRIWERSLPPTHVVVYSDGSKLANGAVGYGFVVYKNQQEKASGCGRLADPSEVFDGEAEGARHGLQAALRLFPGTPIHICLDNSAVATGLLGNAPDSSQEAFLEIHAAMENHHITVHWVPGHKGITGNEKADAKAKEGASLPVPEGARPSVAGIKTLARAQGRQAHQTWWHTKITPRYANLGLTDAPSTCPPALQLERWLLHRLLAARTGHGDFKWYHTKFKHTEYDPCECGGNKSPSHPVFCIRTRSKRRLWPVADPPPERDQLAYWYRIIAAPKLFAQFVKSTGVFARP